MTFSPIISHWLKQSIWLKITRSGGCWLWVALRTQSGARQKWWWWWDSDGITHRLRIIHFLLQLQTMLIVAAEITFRHQRLLHQQPVNPLIATSWLRVKKIPWKLSCQCIYFAARFPNFFPKNFSDFSNPFHDLQGSMTMTVWRCATVHHFLLLHNN